ncbi:MAG: conjugal transfer protein TraA [Flavobacteriaceae bacterium]|nr:MAG: conjugal transfer protein TraA [Flavobacteriaceae bacterium]
MTKIILITHQKGGVGKSTLTFNLAQNIAKSTKVAVIDFDLQGSLAQLKELIEDFDIIPYEMAINEIPNLPYDFIFIDTPPYLSNNLPQLLQIADLILIPTKAGILDLLAIKSTIDIINTADKRHYSRIVFNMIKPNTTLTADIRAQLDEYNFKIYDTQISDLVAFTRSVLLKGVTDSNKAQRQIDSLTKEVLTSLI